MFRLPVSALAVLSPVVSALVLTYREEGPDGVRGLMKRPFDYKRIKPKVWYLPIVLLMPLVVLIDYVVMRRYKVQLPSPHLPLMLPAYFVLFFMAATCEELGWTAYATDRLQGRRGNALWTGLSVGFVWAVWHIVPWIPNHSAVWVAGQAANTVLKRVLTLWLYNNTGRSLFAAISFHASANVSELVLFPVYGSYYNPVLTFYVLLVITAGVVFLWGPRTLARYRYA